MIRVYGKTGWPRLRSGAPGVGRDGTLSSACDVVSLRSRATGVVRLHAPDALYGRV
jgi:hypothetical protein